MIILTDSKKNCPVLEGLVAIDKKSIMQFDGNTDVSAIVCSRATARQVLSLNFPNLKYIQLFSAGYDGIDIDAVRQKGITLCNAANVYNIGMAEFVVYAMLMAAKRYHKNIKNHHLRPLRNYHYITELYGKTVGIMGCGNIGCQIAQRLAAFDMKVIGYDARTSERPHIEKIYGLEERDEFVQQCDYLVNCIPLMPATEQMLNNDWFSQMKSNITIVNVARKNVICDKDFIPFLKTHKDVTAILDMLEMVPNPITNPYRRLSNVLVLPGVTACSQEINERLHNLIKENMGRFIEGKELLNVITKP